MKSLLELNFYNIQRARGQYNPQGGPPNPRRNLTPDQLRQRAEDLILSSHEKAKRTLELVNLNKLYPWQKKIVNDLRQRKDVSILASPGAGKTMPIIAYWYHDIILQNTNDVQNIIQHYGRYPKIVICVPSRSLAELTAREFTDRLLLIVIKELMDRADDMETLAAYGRILKYNILPIDMQRLNDKREQGDTLGAKAIAEEMKKKLFNTVFYFIRDKLITLAYGGGGISGNPATSPVVITTYGMLDNVLPKLIPAISDIDLVLFDEFHYLTLGESSGGMSSEGYKSRAKEFYSALQLMAYLIGKRAKLVLMSGTLNPLGTKEIAQIFNQVFDRRFDLNDIRQISARNKTKIDVIPNDAIRNDDELVNLVRKAIIKNEKNKVILLFSVTRIRNLAEKVLKATQTKNAVFQEALFIPSMTADDIERLKQIPKANEISDSLLRQCVARKFGFIYTGASDPRTQLSEEDKSIIGELFRKGFINIIFATDSIGIGVNLKVQEMYIPNIKKKQGSSTEVIPKRDLAQALHRVGRGAFERAIVYTPSEYVDYVKDALISSPEDFDITYILDVPKFIKYSLKISKFLKQTRRINFGNNPLRHRNEEDERQEVLNMVFQLYRTLQKVHQFFYS